MRSPTPKLHLPSRVAQICPFTSQPYVRDVRQRLHVPYVLRSPSGLAVIAENAVRSRSVGTYRLSRQSPQRLHHPGRRRQRCQALDSDGSIDGVCCYPCF